MTDRVRVGMIGTSWWADQMHLPAVASHPRARLTAICGRSRERAEELARTYGIANVFTDYSDLISSGQVDAVIIAVPDDLHYPIAMAALDAGLHVLCEKPLAFTLEQARAMLAKAESARVRHMTYFTYRWMPHFRYLRQLVEEGYIGRCGDARFHYVGSYARGAARTWKWDRARGLGVLGDLGSHMIDQARLLTRIGMVFVMAGRTLTLANWLDKLPGDVVSSHPALVSLLGTLHATRGDNRQALELFDLAESKLQGTGNVVEWTRTLVRRAEVCRQLGHYDRAQKDVEQILELSKDSSIQEMQYMFWEALRIKGLVLFALGNLKESLTWLQEALRVERVMLLDEQRAGRRGTRQLVLRGLQGPRWRTGSPRSGDRSASETFRWSLREALRLPSWRAWRPDTDHCLLAGVRGPATGRSLRSARASRGEACARDRREDTRVDG